MKSLYPTADEPAESSTEKTGQAPSPKEDGKSALLPKSMFGDAKPGETITLKVEHVYDDEIQVCAYDGDEKTEPADGQNDGEPEPMGDHSQQSLGY